MEVKIDRASTILRDATRAWLNGITVIPPIMLWGTYGIGKSSIVRQIALDLDIDCHVMTVADLTPQDLRGLPDIEVDPTLGRLAIFAPPKEIPQTGKGILFFDELNQGDPTLMAVAQRLLLDRQLGECKLGDGWYIVAAGNKAVHRAAVHEMPDTVKNRVSHLELVPDYQIWKAHAIEHGLDGLPLMPEIVGYLNFASQDFHPDIESVRHEDAKPTGRTWSKLNAWMHAGMPYMAPATVGVGVGNQFLKFLEISEQLPNIDGILSGENVPPVPKSTDVSILYSAVSALSVRIVRGNYTSKISGGQALVNALEWIISNPTKPTEFMLLACSDILKNPTFRKNHAAEFCLLAVKSPTLKPKIEMVRGYLK